MQANAEAVTAIHLDSTLRMMVLLQMYIMTKCVDEISYERLPDERNRMRLVKKMPIDPDH